MSTSTASSPGDPVAAASPPPTTLPDAVGGRDALRRRLGAIGVPLILLALVLIFQAINDAFLSGDNIRTIFESAALPTVVACGLTVVLVLGQFDLSIQAVAGLGTTAVAVLMAKHGLSVAPAIALVVLGGALVGLVNGVLVAYARLAALVVTIGMASLLNGAEFALTGSQAISTGIPPGFIEFARSEVGPIPTLVIVAAGAALVIWLLLDRTALGREMRAVGANADAARFAGVNVERMIVIGFVVAAVAAAVAGLLYAGRQGNVYPLTGMSILLQSFAACFIGAAMFRVGQFNIPGTIVGSLLAAVVSNGLLLANVANYATYFFQGGILIAAILFARVVGGRAQEA